MDSPQTIQGRKLRFGQYYLRITFKIDPQIFDIDADQKVDMTPLSAIPTIKIDDEVHNSTIEIKSLAPSSNPVFNLDEIRLRSVLSLEIKHETGVTVKKESNFNEYLFVTDLSEVIFLKPSITVQFHNGYFIDKDALRPTMEMYVPRPDTSVFCLPLQLKRQIHAKLEQRLKIEAEIEDHACKVKDISIANSNWNWRRMRLVYLDTLIASKRRQIQIANKRMEHAKAVNHFVTNSISKLEIQMPSNSIQQALEISRLQLGNLSSTVKKLQSERISQIQEIFPIEQSCIRGIFVPDSVFVRVEKETVALSLNYVARSVILLAYYLRIPIRYPISLIGNRSLISDKISHFLGPREFPLYPIYLEKGKFDYAVFLLNKNIQQICSYVGARVVNLRKLIGNLDMIYKKIAADYS